MKEHTFTIAQGAQVSNVIDLTGRAVIAAEAPDTTGTLSFNAGRDPTALKALTIAGTAPTFTKNKRELFSPILNGVGCLQVASSQAEASARTIYVYTEDYGS